MKKKLENMTPRNLTEKRPLESNVLFSTSDQVTTNLGKKGIVCNYENGINSFYANKQIVMFFLFSCRFGDT